jgi:putative addiction module antidote
MLKIKLTTVGNSVGVILPKELLERMNLAKGDTLCVSETPNGIELSPYDAEFERAMDAGRKVMRRYRNTLRELAK